MKGVFRSTSIPDTGLYVEVLQILKLMYGNIIWPSLNDLRTEREGVAEKQTIELVSCQKIS